MFFLVSDGQHVPLKINMGFAKVLRHIFLFKVSVSTIKIGRHTLKIVTSTVYTIIDMTPWNMWHEEPFKLISAEVR